jgi:hypothetical protein
LGNSTRHSFVVYIDERGDDADHFEECPACGHLIDCRDLAEVLERRRGGDELLADNHVQQ